MTDQYEPVTAADLNPGDEVEVVLRTSIGDGGSLKIANGLLDIRHPNVGTIRRKVRPIGVGDRVKHNIIDLIGRVEHVAGERAWVFWDVTTDDGLTPLDNLTRVTP